MLILQLSLFEFMKTVSLDHRITGILSVCMVFLKSENIRKSNRLYDRFMVKPIDQLADLVFKTLRSPFCGKLKTKNPLYGTYNNLTEHY